MDFGWNEQQRKRYDAVLSAVGEAFAEPRGRDRYFTREDWQQLGKLGLLGCCISADVGGQALGALDTAHLVEAFGRACKDTGLVFGASAQLFACTVPIDAFGRPAVRERYLPALCTGNAIAGNAMTEAESGSDVSRLQVSATAVPGGFVLKGEKSFVSNGPVADVFVTYATTDPAAGHLGQTAFVLDADAAGVVVGEPMPKMGLDSCPAGQVGFEDCFVPAEQVLGQPGMGGAVFQHSMGWERACLFAGYLGMLERLLDGCVAHARQRRQFRQRLADFQAISHRIADMKLRTEAARLLLYRACWEMDQGGPATLAVALSKLAVSEGVIASALDAVTVHGARGYLTEYGIEAELRSAIPAVIFSGTSDIQRTLVARELGL